MAEITLDTLENVTGGTEGTVGKDFYYVVQRGDTWESIAAKFEVRLDILKHRNAGLRLRTGLRILVHGTYLGTAF